jgi:hypothetical protein
MGKFLAIFNPAAEDADKAEFTEQQRTEFMTAWAAWAQVNQRALCRCRLNTDPPRAG